LEKQELIQEIIRLKKEKNAVILAHNYQTPEIQEIADFVGDSLELAKISHTIPNQTIVFCGVFFMAETAHILAPEKKVLLPSLDAGCPMADMADPHEILELKKEHPDAAVVTYVNSTAEIKAISDICCTSSNAFQVLNSVKEKKIIFIPDRNLGRNLARFISKEFFYIVGYCPVHEAVKKEEILKLKEIMPDAEILMHPEVNPEVAVFADKLLSTGNILKYAMNVSNKNLIIATEAGLLYQLHKKAPQNRYFNIGRDMICPNMKKTNLQNVYEVLKNESNQVVLDPEIREKAKKSIVRMLEI